MKSIDFGFIFSRVMWFYGLTDLAVLAMPAPRFWLLAKNIDRLQAEEDQRQLVTMASAASDKGYKALYDRLQKQLGNIAEIDQVEQALEHDKLDRAGLKTLAGMGRV